MDFKLKKISKFVTLSLLASTATAISQPSQASEWIIDGISHESGAWNDYQPWEYDSCLRNSPALVQDRRFAYVAINNDVDVLTGSAHIDVMDYNSGHDVLPIKMERVYKTSGSFKNFGKVRTQWFTSFEYGITNINNAISSAKAASEGGIQEPRCEGYYGWGEIPLVLGQGTAGAISLYGRLNKTTKEIEWYTRKDRTNHSKVKLINNSDLSWTYYDADGGTIQKYDKNGRILSITDAATRIALTWSYGSSYQIVTRTGGEWIKINNIVNNTQIIETSGGSRFTYSKKKSYGNLDSLEVTYPPEGTSKYSYNYILYGYTNDGLLKYETQNSAGGRRSNKEFSWDRNGLITYQKSDAGENKFTYSGIGAKNNTTNIVISATNGKGRVSRFVFDGNHHNLTRIEGSGGGLPNSLTKFTSPGSSYSGVFTETDAIGNVTRIERDERGWESVRADAFGTTDEVTTKTVWMDLWHQPKRIETDLETTEFEYYSNDRPLITSITKIDKITGQVRKTTISYKFHANGLISEVVTDGPRDDISDTSYQYYASNGRLIKTIDSLGHTTSYSNYDKDGRTTSISYPDGSTKSLAYNQRGYVKKVSIKNSIGISETSYEYDVNGNVIRETNPAGVVTERTYAGDGTLKTERKGNFRKFFSYDNLGKIAKERIGDIDPDIDALVGTESCEYRDYEAYNCHWYTIEDSFIETKISNYESDALGRLITAKDSRDYAIKYYYDLLSRKIETIDQKGISTEKLGYDRLGRIVSRTDAVGRVTKYSYDQNSNVIKITDNANRVFNYDYDGFGQLISSNTPSEGRKSFEYDSAGNLIVENLNDGSSIHYSYDELNRLTRRSMSDGMEHLFDYDATTSGVGLIGKTTEESGSTTYSYDSLTRNITKQVYAIGGNNYAISYTYDVSGRVQSITYPSGYKVYYSYNSDSGNVNKISDSNSTTIASNIVFEPYGPVRSYTLMGNGLVSYNRDKDYRVKKIKSSKLNIGYNYDPVGHIIDKLDGSGKKVSSFSYFNNHELKTETNGSVTNSYTYDNVGNRASENNLKYGYDSRKMLTSYNGSVIKYDGRGNIIYDTVHSVLTTREFGVDNQLKKAVRSSTITSFQYDALGHRTVKNGPSGNYQFIHDVNGRLLAESLNGVIKKEYIYLGSELVAVRYNNAIYSVLSDITKRPELVTNTSGSVVWKASNTAFNRSVTQNGLGDFNIGYPGQYYDKETDTWYNLNRYYDAKTGRYLQSDPKGTVDGPNTYVYAGNNPVNRIDPTGEYFWVIVGAAVDIGLQAYENGWDFSKVNYLEVAVNSINPAKVLRWGKTFHRIQEVKSAKSLESGLSSSYGVVAKGGEKVSQGTKNAGKYRPDRKLPRDEHGNPVPDSDTPHTQLGTKAGRNGEYTQAREWGHDSNGNLVPKRDIDFTDHGRPQNHPNPHQHDWIPNPTGGTPQHGPAKPLEMP